MSRFSKMNFKSMRNKVVEDKKKTYNSDERFWELTKDKEQFGTATFRYLPDPNGVPFIQYFEHWFPYNDGENDVYYKEKCIYTLGQQCPICKKNFELRDTGHPSDKKTAERRYNQKHYVANIYMINDPANAENNGKVFLFDFKAQIFTSYDEMMFGDKFKKKENPDYEGPMPCDFIEGADFNCRSFMKEKSESLNKGKGYPDYTKSAFEANDRFLSHLDDEEWEEEIDRIMGMTFDLGEFVDPKLYPTAKETKKRLEILLGDSGSEYPEDDFEDEEEEEEEFEESDDTDPEEESDDTDPEEESDDTDPEEESDDTDPEEELDPEEEEEEPPPPPKGKTSKKKSSEKKKTTGKKKVDPTEDMDEADFLEDL